MIEAPCPLCEKYGPSDVCPVCKGTGFVHKRSDKERKARRNEKSRKYATRQYCRWSKRDMMIIKDSFYSAAQVAAILHRSIKSIENIRYRIRKGLYHEQQKKK